MLINFACTVTTNTSHGDKKVWHSFQSEEANRIEIAKNTGANGFISATITVHFKQGAPLTALLFDEGSVDVLRRSWLDANTN